MWRMSKKLDDDTISALNDMGFKTLAMRDALADEGIELMQMITLMKTFMLAVLIIALFFISYFIIRIVLKSRNAYYTTLRTLGASRKISRQLLDIELFLTCNHGICPVHGCYGAGLRPCHNPDLCCGSCRISDTRQLCCNIHHNHRHVLHDITQVRKENCSRDSVMNTYREEA